MSGFKGSMIILEPKEGKYSLLFSTFAYFLVSETATHTNKTSITTTTKKQLLLYKPIRVIDIYRTLYHTLTK